MPSQRDWFKHDAWFLADDKIRSLGHEFGAQGPLVAEALLELAKRQRSGGDVEVRWSYLAEHAFVKNRPTARRIIEACERLEFIAIDELDGDSMRLTLPKWRQHQGAGIPGAERTAAWRNRKRDESVTSQDENATSQNGHGDDGVTSPPARSREGAPAQVSALRGRTETKGLNVKGLNISSSAAARQDDKASDEDRANCRLFAELLKAFNPKAKIKSSAEWLKQMRLLREQDGNSAAEIDQAIRWVFTDPGRDARFWARTIQSPGGLREHFAQIWAQMTAEKPGAPQIESSASMLARRGAQ